jgi:hypothetical protein
VGALADRAMLQRSVVASPRRRRYILAVATIMAVGAGCRMHDERVPGVPDSPALVVVQSASHVHRSEIYDGQVTYTLPERYPATQTITTIQTRLRELGFPLREHDFLNRQGSSATRGGWSEVLVEGTHVLAWAQQWENPAGDILLFGLTYRGEPPDDPNVALDVIASYFKRPTVEAIQRSQR